METLVKDVEGEQVDVGAGALPLSGFTKPNLKFISKPSKSIPKEQSTPEDFDIEDLVHKIENLKKEEALAQIAQLEDAREMTFFKMGGVLSVIHGNKFYAPHKSFNEWVKNETAMKPAKAWALIQIYNTIVDSGNHSGSDQAYSLDQAAGDRANSDQGQRLGLG